MVPVRLDVVQTRSKAGRVAAMINLQYRSLYLASLAIFLYFSGWLAKPQEASIQDGGTLHQDKRSRGRAVLRTAKHCGVYCNHDSERRVQGYSGAG